MSCKPRACSSFTMAAVQRLPSVHDGKQKAAGCAKPLAAPPRFCLFASSDPFAVRQHDIYFKRATERLDELLVFG